MNTSVIFINEKQITKEIIVTDFGIIKRTFQKIGEITCTPSVIPACKKDFVKALNGAVTENRFVIFVGNEPVDGVPVNKIISLELSDFVLDDNKNVGIKENHLLSTVFRNGAGDTHGYGFTYMDSVIITCPSDPAELAYMIKNSIGLYLLEKARNAVIPDNESEGNKKASTQIIKKSARHKNRKRSPSLGRVDIFLRILLVAVICSSVFFTYKLVKSWTDTVASKNDYLKIASDAHPSEIKDTADFDPMQFDLAAIKPQNSDLVGYVKVNGTKIDYPVTQTNDNAYYLKRSFLKKNSEYGCVFLDSETTLTKKKTSQNLVLYGHNMNNGTMFGELSNYKDLNFYRANPVIYFNTIYRQDVWKVFAVYIVNTTKADDNGYAFNYMQSDFGSENAFTDFIKETKRRSILNIPVEVNLADQLLTLSTNDYSFKDARLIVVAKRINTSGETKIDTMRARNNPGPLYPSVWYVKNGGKKPTEEQMEVFADIFK